MKRTSTGYTLVEVMVTVVIVGVLAGLALPSYFSTVEEARSNEAKINLQIIRAGEKVRALNNDGVYWITSSSPVTAQEINGNLGVDLATSYYDITSITNVGGNTKTFKAVATRNSSKGGDINKKYSITDAQSEPISGT